MSRRHTHPNDRELDRERRRGVDEISPRRTERIELRLTEAELAAWTKTAEAAALTLSDMVRAAVEEYASRGDADRMAQLGRQVAALVDAARLRKGR